MSEYQHEVAAAGTRSSGGHFAKTGRPLTTFLGIRLTSVSSFSFRPPEHFFSLADKLGPGLGSALAHVGLPPSDLRVIMHHVWIKRNRLLKTKYRLRKSTCLHRTTMAVDRMICRCPTARPTLLAFAVLEVLKGCIYQRVTRIPDP